MLFLEVHAPGAEPYLIEDRQDLVDAVEHEADSIAADAGSDLLSEPTEAERKALKKNTVTLMLSRLWRAGDSCTTQDGTRYSLVEKPDQPQPQEV